MKKLFLVRHAKSSWSYTELSDFERPLNKRGRRDAPFMAKLLSQQGVSPDKIVSSPANRAITTALFFCDPLNYNFDDISLVAKLYEASSDEILEVIRELDNSFNDVILFAHNPGLTDLANRLVDNSLDNIPTCGIVSLNLNIESWNKISLKKSEMILFEYPKKYFK